MNRRNSWQHLTREEIDAMLKEYETARPTLMDVIFDTGNRLYEKNNRRYCVDGTHSDGTMQADGESPPFMIFDIEAQKHLPAVFADRAGAESVLALFSRQ